MDGKIQLIHGDGGLHTDRLIRGVFYRHFDNEILENGRDAAVLPPEEGRLAFTTDSFVVKPLFFPGGDIGKLSVCGTVNDLAAAGALPLYIAAGFIIEEGFDMERLDAIAASMAAVCRQVGAQIVAGDTKVVEKGLADGVFINTSGIGRISALFTPEPVEDGDEILLTGTAAEHGTAVMLQRQNGVLRGDFASDCAPLSGIIAALGEELRYIKLMRDPTRGGVATALCELSDEARFGALIEEERIPIRPCVRAVHELLGTDPLYFACEGRLIVVAQKGHGERILRLLRTRAGCGEAALIGYFDRAYKKVCLRTPVGGERILTLLENRMISRIC